MSAILPPVMGHPLTPQDTVPMGRVRHRLLMGVQWRDAVTQYPVTLPGGALLRTELEAVGQRPCPMPWVGHGEGRVALRHEGRVARLLARALEQAEPVDDGNPANDADGLRLHLRAQDGLRWFVPRRLSVPPVLNAGVPPATLDNIREAWLWPGARYPLPSHATAVRGTVWRTAAPGVNARVPWGRVVITRPGNGAPNVATEARLAHGHVDDRGEFVAVLGPGAVTGAALPAQLPVHLWVYLPPAMPDFDAEHPEDSLPLERASAARLDDVLRGTQVPAGYTVQAVRPLNLVLGRTHVVPDASLVFA
ncbi:hypothetical protein WNB94_08505 [Aquabacterium sp. A3]|uniref:hypothetical protein n=1 Tax=Aquabacterium sp. A3 TaxID=3132829 RepID=UPI0031193C95